MEYLRQWRLRNPNYTREYWLKLDADQRLKIRNRVKKNKGYYAKWMRDRRRSNPSFRLRHNLTTSLNANLRGKYKSKSTIELLGCSIENLWIYLESKFQDGMTRENYGKLWHVDHIMPCAIFDLANPEHQKICFHFSNLQPLFGKINQSKGKKVSNPQFNLPL